MLIIGDVHGKIDEYKQIIKEKNPDFSLQVGDMGFDYSRLSVSAQHRFVGGNHDNYKKIHPRMLGDFGTWQNIFYIRGAFSIDKAYRIVGKSWFSEEELDYETCENAIQAYNEVRPNIVVTHTAPLSVIINMGFMPLKTRTAQMLDVCLSLHQPVQWIFGHFHKSWVKKIENTTFRCLDELEIYHLNGTKNERISFLTTGSQTTLRFV